MSTHTITKSTKKAPTNGSNLLRRAVQGNGIFSGLGGLVFLGGAKPLATFMGVAWPAALAVMGGGLVVYAGILLWAAAQETINRPFARTAVVLDVVWVVGSILLLLTDWLALTTAGKWTVALLAEAVFTFAILQAYGLRRSR